MKELDLGRTPIREALKVLQTENLVVVKPRRGIFVSDIAITDLAQIFEVRLELAALAARLATRRITPSQLARLRKLAAQYETIDQQDKSSLIELDKKFHALIAEASQNEFLRQNLANYYNLSLRIWYLAIGLANPEDIDVSSHLDLLKAVEASDAEKAADTVQKHIKDFHKTIKKYL
jgi:DNA-binding GntR family transcriptional regulator